MIEIETDRPVYSNAKGDKKRLFNKNLTEEQKLARKKRLTAKAKGLYGKAKESGILSSLENLALGNMNRGTGSEVSNEVKIPAIETLPPRGWSSYSKTKKGVIVTSSLVVVGLIVYFAAFRKK